MASSPDEMIKIDIPAKFIPNDFAGVTDWYTHAVERTQFKRRLYIIEDGPDTGLLMYEVDDGKYPVWMNMEFTGGMPVESKSKRIGLVLTFTNSHLTGVHEA